MRLRDLGLTVGILIAACGLCFVLGKIDSNANYVSIVFVLAVFMCARFTEGYLCGILASIAGVLAVNYIFTYPYFRFNFTLSGYPLTILCMLAVSIATSALMTQVKQNERVKMEAEREKMRGNLLRAVSHDLRTPLTSILGATSAVIENDEALTSGERVALLRGAQQDAQWLIRMVENLLAVTRIDGDSRAKIVKTPEAAEEIVAEVVTKFKKRFPGSKLNVRVPDELLIIPMDAVLIEQVIFNLLENAVQHGKTTTCIDLSVSRRGRKAVFEVRDDGVGIDPRKIQGIFEGSVSGSGDAEGDGRRNMGIGLSVCNTIIQAHGGTLRARNSTSGGAVFRFELDAERAEETALDR